MADVVKLQALARLVRHNVLTITSRAGSGHPTSCLSAVELMVALYFDKLRYDLGNPGNILNDRIIFSKGHAAPLLYSLWAAAGAISQKELMTYREFGSKLEGHPVPRFKFVDVATGSLGQGLSCGVGFALTAKLDKLPYITYVLMGDSESAEGSVWEAMEIASHYKLGNLVAIMDINRLGQSRPTMLEWNLEKYRSRFEAFGWRAIDVDGHNFQEITDAYERIDPICDQPTVILAKTLKGKGVSFLEDKVDKHGIALKDDELKAALFELGEVDLGLKGEIAKPQGTLKAESEKLKVASKKLGLSYKVGDMVATRQAYGEAITAIGKFDERIVVLDGETSNSTFAKVFREQIPDRYFEMFIAEQNMVGTALGMSKMGKIPFASTFAVFWTRAYDQIRMSAISEGNVRFVGSHGGVSIGADGPSQMGLEDFSMFRAIFGSVVLCPSDANSTVQLVEQMVKCDGMVYLRTARPATEVFYGSGEAFKIGGSKVLRRSKSDKATVVAVGLSVLEAIRAADDLLEKGVNVRVIDAYSVKPIDKETLVQSALETNNLVITVEDHFMQGGLGDAVLEVFATHQKVRVFKLAVSKMPGSATPEEQYKYQGIDSASIVKKVMELVG